MREIKVCAPAKINLYLDILDKRPDGFHDIETLFEKIDLKDEIIIREKGVGINVNADERSCPQGEENIVYKAIQAVSLEAKVDLNLDVRIIKNIPLSAGLGGGSSDAAAALRAINDMFELGVSDERLFSIAGDIGKDVPFFMLDAAFAVGRGAGEILEPIRTDYTLWHLLINPGIAISTALMYKRIDEYNRGPARKPGIEGMIRGLKEKDAGLVRTNYYNVFEEVLGEHDIHIKRIKDLLLGAGADTGLLSGSGSTVFCTFEDKGGAEKVLKKIPENTGMDVFLVKTYR
ncbi:MAG: 4-(cytidine 5'-diphospho)-2-C-methyl-D-erythritol kinase [Candidatus Omnitrophota bacterium]